MERYPLSSVVAPTPLKTTSPNQERATMTNTDAGANAGSECTPIASDQPSSKPPISPAARKFAEYLARRMAPMIESAAKRTEEAQHGAVEIHTETKRG
jgi:hypothetical protein